MKHQLLTNWKGLGLSIAADHITAIIAKDREPSECLVYVLNSDEPFHCSETYEVISKKVECLLLAREG